MKKIDININSSKQRCLLMLLPLMLLALSTWFLESPVLLPSLTEEQHNIILVLSRVICFGLFSIVVAFMVPTFDRVLQIVTISVVYSTLVAGMLHYNTEVLYNPIAASIASITSLFALLPHYDFNDQPENRLRQRFVSFCFSLVLPIFAFVFLIIVLQQIDLFIMYTFDEMFGRSLLSAIYVPIFLVLQLVGCQSLVGTLVSLHYDENMITAFINAVIVTNFVSLPAILCARSFFSQRHLLLFINLLVVLSILTSSISACSSLILFILVIFYPGSFVLLLLSGTVCFFASLFMQVPPITTVNNLYMPDIDLTQVTWSFVNQHSIFNLIALFFPIAIMAIFLVAHREQIFERNRLLSTMSAGYSAGPNSSSELYFIAFLRACGGLSNITHIEEKEGKLSVWVNELDAVSSFLLNTLLGEKALLYRFDKMYICNTGKKKSVFIAKRLSRMLESQFGEEKAEIPVCNSVSIRVLAHTKNSDVVPM